jgi:hypothetical protein
LILRLPAATLALRRLEIELPELQHIAKAAEKACAAAGNYPRNAYLREDLFDLLGPLTK